MGFLSKQIGVRIMEKFKHIREITLIKNAFPMEWKDEFMELLNHPNEDWIRYSHTPTLYEGPKISKTPLGDRWRTYAFNKWKDEFGIENKLNDEYESSNGVYWGDFLLEFKEGHYLVNHRDVHNPKELRFNVLLQKPKKGGVYTINGKELHMDEGDMVVFSPQLNFHRTDKIIGTRSRALLSLSFIQKEIKSVL